MGVQGFDVKIRSSGSRVLSRFEASGISLQALRGLGQVF